MRLILVGIVSALIGLGALGTIPGMSIGVVFRTYAFVAVAPWLVALVIVPPGVLRAAFKSLTRRTKAMRATADALEAVAELTVASGAMTAILSWIATMDHAGALPEPGFFGRTTGLVLAAGMGGTFAATLWLGLYTPTTRRLRAALSPEDLAEPRRVAFGWRLVAVVVATVITVEAIRSYVTSRPAKPARPAVDCAFTIGDEPSAEDALRIELRSETAFVVDGNAVPSSRVIASELESFLQSRPGVGSRPFEIAAPPGVALGQVIGALDACMRIRGDRSTPRIHVVTPDATRDDLTYRLAHRTSMRGVDLVLLELPASGRSDRSLGPYDDRLIVNLAYDPQVRTSELIVKRMMLDYGELRDFLSPPGRPAKQVLIRADRAVPFSRVISLLDVLAEQPIVPREILFEVQAP